MRRLLVLIGIALPLAGHAQVPSGSLLIQAHPVPPLPAPAVAGPDVTLPSYAMAALPAAVSSPGAEAWCSDCVNTARGDTAGHGTGTVVVSTGAAWMALGGTAATD